MSGRAEAGRQLRADGWSGSAHRHVGGRGPGFVLLGYRGQTYGLSQALSGSGARYASPYGPTPGDHGLEWWEHVGQGTLSRFTGKDLYATAPLLRTCRAPHAF